jgi:phage terminase large subunit-like protein
MAEPLHASPRRRDRRSNGRRVADLSRSLLALRMMRWQRQIVDIAGERDGELPAYRNVIISTMRQVGKTSLLGAVMLDRMRSDPGCLVLFAAQSRLAARAKLFDVWWPSIRRSRYREEFLLTRATGAEALRHLNGSIMRIVSAEEESSHGESAALTVIDEAWALGPEVEQGLRAATLAIPGSQVWITSTAGNTRSTWWRSKVDAGREMAAAGEPSASCYFEWGAPLDADPADPLTWRRANPALGVTIPEAVYAEDQRTLPAREFARSHLNQWADDLGLEGWNVFTQQDWARAIGEAS